MDFALHVIEKAKSLGNEMTKMRVFRIIEYVGDEQWIRDTLRDSAMKRDWWFAKNKKGKIRASVIGQFSEVVKEE